MRVSVVVLLALAVALVACAFAVEASPIGVLQPQGTASLNAAPVLQSKPRPAAGQAKPTTGAGKAVRGLSAPGLVPAAAPAAVAPAAAAPAAAAPAAVAPAAAAAPAAAGAPAAAAGGAKPKPGTGVGGRQYTAMLKSNPAGVFAKTINARVQGSLADFRALKRLPNGRIYGASMKSIKLNHKSADAIAREAKKFACVQSMDVLKNVTNNLPIQINGKTVPMIVFLCPDGGAIRLKPQGDPTSKFRPQPQGSKALRFPYDSAFVNFDDEIVKVTDTGIAVPKSAPDLAIFSTDKAVQFDATDAWANSAHMDLAK